MLTVSAEALEFLFTMLKDIKSDVADDACFRLTLDDEVGEGRIELSHEQDDDDTAAHGDHVVVAWDSSVFGASRDWLLDLDEDDPEDPFLVLRTGASRGVTAETAVEIDESILALTAD